MVMPSKTGCQGPVPETSSPPSVSSKDSQQPSYPIQRFKKAIGPEKQPKDKVDKQRLEKWSEMSYDQRGFFCLSYENAIKAREEHFSKTDNKNFTRFDPRALDIQVLRNYEEITPWRLFPSLNLNDSDFKLPKDYKFDESTKNMMYYLGIKYIIL